MIELRECEFGRRVRTYAYAIAHEGKGLFIGKKIHTAQDSWRKRGRCAQYGRGALTSSKKRSNSDERQNARSPRPRSNSPTSPTERGPLRVTSLLLCIHPLVRRRRFSRPRLSRKAISRANTPGAAANLTSLRTFAANYIFAILHLASPLRPPALLSPRRPWCPLLTRKAR